MRFIKTCIKVTFLITSLFLYKLMTGLIEDKEQLGIKMLFYKNSVNNFIVKSRYRYKNHKNRHSRSETFTKNSE